MTLKLIYPALAMIGWIFVVCIIMAMRRREAFVSGAVKHADVAVSGERYPLPARLAAANFSNQFETPVLFFVLILLAIHVGATSYVMAALAWLYVVSRIVHTLIHIGPNKLPLRGAVYSVGFLALVGMWVGVLLAAL